MAASPHISIKGEIVANIYGFPVTNSLIASLIVTGIFAVMAMAYKSESEKEEKANWYYAINGGIMALFDLMKSVLHSKVNFFFPLLGAFFFFTLLNNVFGLLPFVSSYFVEPITIGVQQAAEHATKAGDVAHTVPLLRGGSADLNLTLALALITVIGTQIFGFKYLGAKEHLKKYASGIGLLEGFTEFIRIISFSFRLFGNILAGEIIIGILAFLLPVWIGPIVTPTFFLFELFVCFIQAVVFTLLSAVFINLAVNKSH